ncbi:hypothetical protein JL193_01020 [Polaribacter batillariae]|uniref:Fibrobacter succinogenes major paralogous domain-containing protein n=1 Tax=Polaribacter batillariae TaxID=2808900 RepID=A0ABX7SUL8_9FLAO|nr:FISUMP domain-containing protein [Polaribacter batillariae]QTD37922.1 hypothetical protein JL193_01020 [Polaribacter batillariae]
MNNNTTAEIPVQLKNTTEIKNFIDTRDNKSYKYGKIGNQIWMLENLSFNYSGSLIYNDSIKNSKKYGRLYTFEMANNCCPVGWRLPSIKEWNELIEFSGGSNIAAKVLKSTKLWHKSENTGLNILRFSVYPGGLFTGKNLSKIGGVDKKYKSLGYAGYFWANDVSLSTNFSKSVTFFYNQNFIYQSGSDRDSYLSVRCIKQ